MATLRTRLDRIEAKRGGAGAGPSVIYLCDATTGEPGGALLAGGGGLRAPATRVTDFLAGKPSQDLPASSYEPGLTPVDLGAVLAASGLPLADRLRDALRVFDKQLRGYGTGDAVLVGVESRTSSPVRMPRDPETLQAPGRAGLYPAGEGAGYAGGIVSAALDGVRIARAIARARGVDARAC